MIEWPALRRFAAAAAVVLGIALPTHAQSALEYDVKAALLLNFARFIEWPDAAFADARAPIEICVFARSPFGNTLERLLQAETVRNRPLTSRVIRTVAESAGCHLLFVPLDAEAQARTLIRQPGPHTITVGESSDFEEQGGAVTFVIDGGRVRFNVNLRPVEARGVRVSARMLQVAGRVARPTPAK